MHELLGRQVAPAVALRHPVDGEGVEARELVRGRAGIVDEDLGPLPVRGHGRQLRQRQAQGRRAAGPRGAVLEAHVDVLDHHLQVVDNLGHQAGHEGAVRGLLQLRSLGLADELGSVEELALQPLRALLLLDGVVLHGDKDVSH